MASGGDVLDRIFGAFLKIGEAFALSLIHIWGLNVGASKRKFGSLVKLNAFSG